jgi:hypothetical protein
LQLIELFFFFNDIEVKHYTYITYKIEVFPYEIIRKKLKLLIYNNSHLLHQDRCIHFSSDTLTYLIIERDCGLVYLNLKTHIFYPVGHSRQVKVCIVILYQLVSYSIKKPIFLCNSMGCKQRSIPFQKQRI